MAVTIKDIAAAVGVSRGTVDRVINHRGGVSEEVAEGRAGCGGDGIFSTRAAGFWPPEKARDHRLPAPAQ